MATRSVLIVKENQTYTQFYRHYDGYLEGAGYDLSCGLMKHYLNNTKAGDWDASQVKLDTNTIKSILENDMPKNHYTKKSVYEYNGVKFTKKNNPVLIPADIEFLYVLDLDSKSFIVYGVRLWDLPEDLDNDLELINGSAGDDYQKLVYSGSISTIGDVAKIIYDIENMMS